MPGFTESEARAILERALKLSQAENCEAFLSANHGGNIRYARNAVTTSGEQQNMVLNVTSSFGKRSGTSTVNEFDDAALERAVRRSEELAKLAPEDPEYVAPLGAQNYRPTNAFFDSTADLTPAARADVCASSLGPAREKGVVAAGFWEDSANWVARANSKGNFAYHRSTGIDFSVTMRTEDGLGSGYAYRNESDATKLDAALASRIAIEKAIASRDARAIEPGKYTVVLETQASSQLLASMAGAMQARTADEGRSFLARAGGGTKLGEKIVDERVTLWSDPWDARVPGAPFVGDGRPAEKTIWVENGVVKNLAYSRYWAEKQGKPATPPPSNLIMSGGDQSLEDLIRGTERGILVTRLWYIRPVDPQTLLFTGLTRDGTFYIENGRIRHAVKNMRFNESPVIMLNNLDALGLPERTRGLEVPFPIVIPPMRVRDFTFTSLSDAV
jgi:predicted Zn-dependent protease